MQAGSTTRTVALGGDGGDELAGYRTHFAWQPVNVAKLPKPVRTTWANRVVNVTDLAR